MNEPHKDFKITLTLAKAFSADGQMMIEGRATGPELDLEGERMSTSVVSSFDEAIATGITLSNGEIVPVPLVSQHRTNNQGVPDWDQVLGHLTKSWIDESGDLWIQAVLDPDNAAAGMLYRKLTGESSFGPPPRLGLSVGGRVVDARKEWDSDLQKYVLTYYKVLLKEVSVVSEPAYPTNYLAALQKSLTAPIELVEKAADAHWVMGASKTLPVVTGGWDGQAARDSIFAWAGWPDNPDPTKAARGFLAYDNANGELKGSYKLPFATIHSGELTAVTGGLRAAESRLNQASIPDDVKKAAFAVIDAYRTKAEDDMTKKAHDDEQVADAVTKEDATTDEVVVAKADETAAETVTKEAEQASEEIVTKEATAAAVELLQKSQYFGDFIESSVTSDTISSLAYRLQDVVWTTFADDRFTEDEQLAALQGALDEFSQLVMGVARAVVMDTAIDTATIADMAKARKETSPMEQEKLDELTKGFATLKETVEGLVAKMAANGEEDAEHVEDVTKDAETEAETEQVVKTVTDAKVEDGETVTKDADETQGGLNVELMAKALGDVIEEKLGALKVDEILARLERLESTPVDKSLSVSKANGIGGDQDSTEVKRAAFEQAAAGLKANERLKLAMRWANEGRL